MSDGKHRMGRLGILGFVSLSVLATVLGFAATQRGGPGGQSSVQAALAAPASEANSWMDYPERYVTRQQAILDTGEEFFERIESRPGYAGRFIDNAAGTVLVIRATGDLPAFQQLAESYQTRDRIIEIRAATYTKSELDELVMVIAKDWQPLRDSGLTIESVTNDPVSNRVTLGVSELTTDDVSKLHTLYGERILVTEEATHEFQHCLTQCSLRQSFRRLVIHGWFVYQSDSWLDKRWL